jgi:thioredoxin-related protein
MSKIAALFAFILLIAFGSFSRAAAASSIQWNDSLSSAWANAKANHKLVMVDFYTDWCGWCKKLDSDVYPDPSVIQAVGQFEAVKVNAEREGAQLAAQCKVSGYPTIAFFNGDGTEVKSIPGYLPADQFAQDLNYVVQNYPYSSSNASGERNSSANTANPLTKGNARLQHLTALFNAAPSDSGLALKVIKLDITLGQINAAERVAKKLGQRNHGAELDTIYNWIGDNFVAGNHVSDAIDIYKLALTNDSNDKHGILYARIRLAQCYQTENDRPDEVTQLDDIIASPDSSQDLKQQAQGLLSTYTSQSG